MLRPFLKVISVHWFSAGPIFSIWEWAIHEQKELDGDAVGKKYIPLEGSTEMGALWVMPQMFRVPSCLPLKVIEAQSKKPA